MKTRITRRNAILFAAGSATVVGCDYVDKTVAETSTPTLENTRLSLRGFQLVAFTVGKRLVQLPHPAVRVIGVALLTSGAATFLVVEYLDTELRRRTVREELEEQERSAIEGSLAVEFMTENGLTETVALGPNQYESS